VLFDSFPASFGLCFARFFFLCQAFVYIILFFITLQEGIDTVTVEGVENVWEEDCINIKTEEDYIQSVGRVKSEQEVSVLCSCVLWY
jgi:hypothetical protein